MHPYLAEFIGTALLILLGNGVVANVVLPQTKGHNGGWIVIAFGWGMAVFVGVWCFGDISGAHLNPAVSVGLAAAGQFAWESVPGYVGAQLLGAIAGAALVFLHYFDHFRASTDPGAKLGCFATGPAIRRKSTNLLSEAIGTFVLVFAGLMAVGPTISYGAESVAEQSAPMKIGLGTLGALPVGLLVLAIGLSLGGTTGYAINPARDLGPRLAHAILPVPGKGSSDWGYAWIPIAGPVLGALLAAGLWKAITA